MTPQVEPAVLEVARRGDEEAFARLIAPFRAPLTAHCRRMLGSAHDADDAMQEVLLNAWRALPRFEGRAPFGAWLHRIATNVCLTAIRQRRGVVVPMDDDGPPQETGPATDSEYEQREAAAVALGITLRHLPATQRAVLILRQVLGFSARETAATLETTTASVNSALQRARANLDRAISEGARSASRRPTEEPWIQEAVEGFVGALGRGDVESLVGIAADPMLAADRGWTYPALPAY